MKLKKQQMILVGVIIIALILVASVAVVMMSNNDGSNGNNNSNNNGNGDGTNGDTNGDGDGSSGDGDGDGDNNNDNGEQMWEPMGSNGITPDGTLYDIHFLSASTGWITSLSNPEIYYTTDGAQTFVSQDNEYNTDIRAIFMLNANEGYAGGESGVVYRTTNSGADWVYHGSLGGPSITDIAFPPGSTTGYGCGGSGNIFEITSSGITKTNINTVSSLASITFPSATEGWCCGENAIRHYTNGAWTADQSYASGGYNSIYFVPGTTQGWCVGDTGRILHTTDGMSWQIQTNPDTTEYTLHDVFFKDTSNGWAVGNGGILLHTTDGGSNWVLQNSGTTNNLYRVFAISSDVYVTGWNGTLLKYSRE